MPEGPEVKRMAESLNYHLSRLYLVDFEINEKSKHFQKVPIKNFEALISGMEFINVSSYGKKIIFSLKSEHRCAYIVTSLGLEGKWLCSPGRNSGIVLKLAKKIAGVLIESPPLYFDDSRHFGTISVCGSYEDLLNIFKNVGPDYLAADVTFEIFYKEIRTLRRSGKKISDFLIDQKIFSGIGNYLRADILYQAEIAPYRHLDSLNDDEIRKLYTSIIDRMVQSYNAGGFTLRTYVRPDGGIGKYEPLVYGKTISPTGGHVVKIKDKQTVFWDPDHQK